MHHAATLACLGQFALTQHRYSQHRLYHAATPQQNHRDMQGHHRCHGQQERDQDRNIKLTKVPFCREREEQRQAKHASADNSKPKKEPASEAAAQQPAQAAVAVLATDVEDSQLPGAAMQPPAADPVGKGLLTSQQLSGSAAVPCCEQGDMSCMMTGQHYQLPCASAAFPACEWHSVVEVHAQYAVTTDFLANCLVVHGQHNLEYPEATTASNNTSEPFPQSCIYNPLILTSADIHLFKKQ